MNIFLKKSSPASIATRTVMTTRVTRLFHLTLLKYTCIFQTFPIRSLSEHNPCNHTIARSQLSITHDTITVQLT